MNLVDWNEAVTDGMRVEKGKDSSHEETENLKGVARGVTDAQPVRGGVARGKVPLLHRESWKIFRGQIFSLD